MKITATIHTSEEFGEHIERLGRSNPGEGLSAQQSIDKFVATDILTGLHLIDPGSYVDVEVGDQKASRIFVGE